MNKHFWVVIVKHSETEVNVSQTIYRDYANAKDFIKSRSGNIKSVGDFYFYDSENGIEYEIKGVEVGD